MSDERDRLEKPSNAAAIRAKLREIVPSAFSEGELDAAKLESLLDAAGESSGTERYELSWAGKREATARAQAATEQTLVPRPDESVDYGGSGNHFIEGENLATLKTLQRSYQQRIKMIYLDPPYNTGSDFIYKDDYSTAAADYERETGQRTADGDKLVSNPETNGRYHSDWLSMMYPRLFLGRNLLRNDGAIFVSIDHNEYHNLRHLMDEIYGEDNYVGTFVWKRRTPDARNSGGMSIDHEYVVVYQRSDAFEMRGVEKSFDNYTNPDDDPRGPWVAGDLKNSRTKDERPTMFYEITDPETGHTYQPDPNSVWRLGEETMRQYIEEGRILFPDDGEGVPKFKRFQNEIESRYKPLSSWIETTTTDEDIELFEDAFDRTVLQTGMTGTATRELKSLFGYKAYDFPKSTDLIRKLIRHSVDGGDIVLDFFAGSGTTGHAVMQLNATEEFDDPVRFMLVQLDDELDEPRGEETTHAEVCERRLRLASEQVADDHDLPDAAPGLGFDKYTLGESRFERWGRPDTESEARAALERYAAGAGSAVDLTDPDAALVEVQLLLGFSLDAAVEALADHTYHLSEDDRDALVTFAESVTYETLTEFDLPADTQYVCLDGSLSDTDKERLNRDLSLRTI
ncbi:site-specific DNA-methyltransferase [Halorubrum ezzemoulense]|uniref:DNA methylase N-4/N-6 domain-containing protein n=1 Tax=Halorubrum ezzemoulense TaxID=337243 RepID=A0A256J7V9_HALEZ|nr:site-specific DNA-methyltransferase [Halorubrum ezzemoulense]OYR64793.1 hypothetical protein DJ80_04075 [Halorubrum ezzemoulense]